MTPGTWEERRSRLLAAEKQNLEQAGTPVTLYTPSPEADPWAAEYEIHDALRLDYEIQGRTLLLFVALPDLYPSFPPAVFAPNERFERHQDPDTGALCLVTDAWQWDAWQWDPSRDNVLTLLTEQLPKLLQAQTAPSEEAKAIEVNAPEPASRYYHHLDGAFVIVDSSWQFEATRGELTIALPSPRGVHPRARLPLLRGAVIEVRDEDGNVVAAADNRLVRHYETAPTITARWKRLPRQVNARDARGFTELLTSTTDSDVRKRQRYRADTPNAPPHPAYLDVYALVTDEEVEHGIQGMGWTFLVRAARRHHPHAQHSEYLVRAVRAGPSDLARRIPELSCLGDKTVIIVGVGGVGSFCALEFARAGVGRLVIVDGDGLEPANSVRWPFGFRAAGEPKAPLLAQFINNQYPYTEAEPILRAIGTLRRRGQKADHLWLEEFLASADLVLNTSGEPLVNLLLGERAKAFGVPYVMAHTTYGGWGGMVARVLPQHDACIWCLQAHRTEAEGADPNGDETLLLPPSDPAGETAPPGCSSPTFTGAGFDTARVAQPAVQLSVSTLCRCDNGYPQAMWDIGTLSLRDPTGKFLEPRWHTRSLLPHPKCNCSES